MDPLSSVGDLPTVGYEGGDPPRVPPVATGFADDDTPDIPGYVVEGELGRGGMGVVYKARQTSLNRPVALKLLPNGKALGPLVRQRFQAEAESAARIVHPGVVAVYEISEHRGRPYFALEYCPGGSLADKLAGTPQPPRQAAELVEKIARAVEAAHAAGVVHRDLKPHNVLFATDGAPKVTDFGLAKWVGGDSSLTTDGAILGTPSYMAPEQARGDSKAVGPAADVYALGAVLYECLTGRPPFRGANLMDTLALLAKAEPVPPRALVPGVPKDLETVCLKCLEKDAGKRYPSAAAVADDLRRFLDGRPTLARPVGRLTRMLRYGRRNPVEALLAGMVFGMVVGNLVITRAKNADLRQERNAAVAARDEADGQRQKADARLAAAVDAVEAMVGLADGEGWVLDAARQPERRALLASAVAFYERLAETDAADPVVRREAAKAQFRTGRAWLGLGETAKAASAFQRATKLGDAAEPHVYLGHALVIDGHFAESLAAYTAGAERAGAAWERSGDPADGLTLITGLTALARYWGIQNPPRAAEYTSRALALAERLNPGPDAPPAHRLALAEAVLLAGDGHALVGRGREAAAAYDRADAVFQSLPPGAPAGMVEAYYRLKATIPIQRGVVRRRAGDPAGAAALIRQGLVATDALLAVCPDGFPYLAVKHSALLELAGACARVGDATARDAADADRRRVGDKLAVTRAGRYMVAEGARRDSELFIEAVRAGRFDATAAAELQRRADVSPLVGPMVRYNFACGHAQMVSHGPPADREAHAAAAVAALAGLAEAGYFRQPTRLRELANDTDLDPLRDRDDFQALAGRVLE